MSYKQLTEKTLLEMRETEKSSNDNEALTSSRYKHSYFIEADPNNPFHQDYLIFTVRVNFLPSRPVYIDISNMRDLIYSMTSNSLSSETLRFRNELLDLLKNYAKNS